MTIRQYLIVPISVLLFVALTISCKKIKKTKVLSLTDSTEFIVSNNRSLNTPFEITTREVKTFSSQYFSNNNTNANLVKEIKLTSLNLTIIDPSGETLSFLKSMKIYLYGNGQPEILLASNESIADSVSGSLDFEPINAKLDAYVKSNAYSLRYEVITDESFPFDVTIQTKMTYNVTASPL
jgi:hypothetical protein